MKKIVPDELDLLKEKDRIEDIDNIQQNPSLLILTMIDRKLIENWFLSLKTFWYLSCK